MEFIDLKTQYAKLQPAIDARMRAVLAHGQFILADEFQELRMAQAIGRRFLQAHGQCL